MKPTRVCACRCLMESLSNRSNGGMYGNSIPFLTVNKIGHEKEQYIDAKILH